MDLRWVVLGLASLGIGIAWTMGLLADRGRPPAQRRNFKGQSLTGPTLAAVLTRHASADEAIRPTDVDGLDLLPADPSLGGVNVALAQELPPDARY